MLRWLYVALLALVQPAAALDLWSSADGSRYWVLDSALKWTSLLSRAPEAPLFYSERWSAAALWRGRLALGAQMVEGVHVRVAYEHRSRLVSAGASLAGATGTLVAENRVPYRLGQVDGMLVQIGQTFAYRHALDRAFFAWRLGSGEVQLGRQAIGWGRGVLFGAVDIFAPFNPLEIDREWRRGVDALRASLPLTELFALDIVAALGESLDESVFVGRLQGYVGEIDGEVLLGRRRRDLFTGTAVSLPVGGAEIHGEVALFATPEAVLGQGRVFKALVGGSYAWDAQGGLLLLGEYHFSGFGVGDLGDLTMHLSDRVYRQRLLRGDAQVLGRHAGALQLSRGIGGVLPLTLGWVFAPRDSSGVLMGVATWVFSDALTLAFSTYWPYGASPSNGALRSEYGGMAKSGLLQIEFYY